MEALFLRILSMSITAVWMIAAVIVARFCLKRAPKWIICLLWALAAIRLVCPFMPESAWSLIPDAVGRGAALTDWTEAYAGDVLSLYENAPDARDVLQDPKPALTGAGGSHIAADAEKVKQPQMSFGAVIPTLARIWIAGAGLLLFYALFSYLRLFWLVRERVPEETEDCAGRLYRCDAVPSPFILGVFRPAIFLPADLEAEAAELVIAHERAHIRRLDYLWKPLGFLILAVHWFNPFCWLAYVLLCRDIELACDEKVIRRMSLEEKKAYSNALLACSVRRPMVTACPLAFGETGVKERIGNVLHYKKPQFWIILTAAVVCVWMAVSFLTNPAGLPISLMSLRITEASVLDMHAGEPGLYRLSDAEVLELTDRIRDLKVGKRASEFGGFTPFYSLYVDTEDTERLIFSGFDTEGDRAALLYEGAYYRIEDADFNAYLRRICTGDGREGGRVPAVEDPRLTVAVDAAQGDAETQTAQPDTLDAAIRKAVLERGKGRYLPGEFACESHILLATEGIEDGAVPAGETGAVTAYVTVLYQEYDFDESGLHDVSGSHGPAALTFTVTPEGRYILQEYWEPRDGSYYVRDIREKFPEAATEDAIDTQKTVTALMQACYAQAIEYKKIDADHMIELLLDKILSSPAHSSNPGDYIEAHPLEYRELIWYGDHTLRYCIRKLQQKARPDLRAQILCTLLNDLDPERVSGILAKVFTEGETYEWNNTAEFKEDASVCIRMAKDPSGAYEMYGIISRELGSYGMVLNHILDGEDQYSYIYKPWFYTAAPSSQPTLEWSKDGMRLVFSYVSAVEEGEPVWEQLSFAPAVNPVDAADSEAQEQYICMPDGSGHKKLTFFYEKNKLVKVEYFLYIKGMPEEMEERERLKDHSGVEMEDRESDVVVKMDAASDGIRYLKDTVPFLADVDDWAWENVKEKLEENGYEIME